jgi:hypothetical protein
MIASVPLDDHQMGEILEGFGAAPVYSYESVKEGVTRLAGLSDADADAALAAWVELWGGTIQKHTDRGWEVTLPETSVAAIQELPAPPPE